MNGKDHGKLDYTVSGRLDEDTYRRLMKALEKLDRTESYAVRRGVKHILPTLETEAGTSTTKRKR